MEKKKLSIEELLAILKKEKANSRWNSSRATYFGVMHEIINERGESNNL